MKKLWVVVLLSVLGVSGVFAQTGEVYSLNVVGFQKLTAATGLVLVSTPFERAPNTLDDVIGAQLTGGKAELTADQVVMWNAQAQSYEQFWLKSTDQKWYTLGGTRATNTVITPQDGFWIRNRRLTNQTVIVSGDVVDDTARTNILLVGLNLVSYPFSSEIQINSSGLTNGKTGKAELMADQIVIWDPASQSYQQYWLKTDRKWYTLAGAVATNVFVGGGRGFWYRNRNTNSFVWVEVRPYTL